MAVGICCIRAWNKKLVFGGISEERLFGGSKFICSGVSAVQMHDHQSDPAVLGSELGPPGSEEFNLAKGHFETTGWLV